MSMITFFLYNRVLGISIYLAKPDRNVSGLSKAELTFGANKVQKITYDQGYGRFNQL